VLWEPNFLAVGECGRPSNFSDLIAKLQACNFTSYSEGGTTAGRVSRCCRDRRSV
jgi:hypothetical protein